METGEIVTAPQYGAGSASGFTATAGFDYELVAEQRRIAELTHQRRCKFVVGVGQDDHRRGLRFVGGRQPQFRR